LKEIPELKSLVAKCTVVAKKSRTKDQFRKAMAKDNHKCINKPIVTRWNAEISMIKRIVAIGRDNLNNILDTCDLAKLRFSSSEWEVIKYVAIILKPFADITTLAQGEYFVTSSLVIPSHYRLLLHLNEQYNSPTMPKQLLPFIKSLESQLSERFNGKFIRLRKLQFN
jgi:hypothetical protein